MNQLSLFPVERCNFKVAEWPIHAIPVQYCITSLVCSIDAASGKALQNLGQDPKEYVYVMICEGHIRQVPSKLALRACHPAGKLMSVFAPGSDSES